MQLGPKQLQWLEALRSDDYDQGVGLLKLVSGQLNERKKLYEGGRTLYCCLGVACDVFKWKETSKEFLRKNYRELGLFDMAGTFKDEAHLNGSFYDSLIDLNDAGISFKQIADYVEQHPENVFLESK